jgi:hypothetical protein
VALARECGFAKVVRFARDPEVFAPRWRIYHTAAGRRGIGVWHRWGAGDQATHYEPVAGRFRNRCSTNQRAGAKKWAAGTAIQPPTLRERASMRSSGAGGRGPGSGRGAWPSGCRPAASDNPRTSSLCPSCIPAPGTVVAYSAPPPGGLCDRLRPFGGRCYTAASTVSGAIKRVACVGLLGALAGGPSVAAGRFRPDDRSARPRPRTFDGARRMCRKGSRRWWRRELERRDNRPGSISVAMAGAQHLPASARDREEPMSFAAWRISVSARLSTPMRYITVP